MTSARSLVASILGAVLSAAPLICAQEVKPSEVSVILPSRPVIQELGLRPQHPLNLLSLRVDPAWAPVIYAHDLSRYREFPFGTSLLAVAKQAGMEPSAAKMIHQRPAIIQELSWQPQRFPGSSLDADSVKEVLFSFYNGELFRMVVNYDRYKTEGLTTEDMIGAISASYGTATRPAEEIMFPAIYNESVKTIARWEDSQYSFNLVRSSYQPSFGMVGFSKRLDTLARAAVTEALRLDTEEAPQREIERQKKHEEETHVQQEKARLANKASFHP